MLNLLPVQTEQGENVIWPNMMITPVHAKESHAKMEKAGDGDKVTDTLVEGAYVNSDYGGIKISREDAKDITLGIKVFPYSEKKKGKEPVAFTLEDIFRKGEKKITPSKIANRVKNRFPIKENNNDIFDAFTDKLNLQSREPFLKGLIALSEIEREHKEAQEENPDIELVPLFKNGGKVTQDQIQQMFLGGLFKGIGKGLGKVAGAITDVAGAAAPFVSFIPGVGQALGPALGAVGGLGDFFQEGMQGGVKGLLGDVAGGGLSGFSGFGGGASSFLQGAGQALGGIGGIRSIGSSLGSMNNQPQFNPSQFGYNPSRQLPGLQGLGSLFGGLSGAGTPGFTGLGQSNPLGGLGSLLSIFGGFEKGGKVDMENVPKAQMGLGAIQQATIEAERQRARDLSPLASLGPRRPQPNIAEPTLAPTNTGGTNFLQNVGSFLGNIFGGGQQQAQQQLGYQNVASPLSQFLGSKVAPVLGTAAGTFGMLNNIMTGNRLAGRVAEQAAALPEHIRGQKQALGLSTGINVLGSLASPDPAQKRFVGSDSQIQELERQAIAQQNAQRANLQNARADLRLLPEGQRGAALAQLLRAQNEATGTGQLDLQRASLLDVGRRGLADTDYFNEANRIAAAQNRLSSITGALGQLPLGLASLDERQFTEGFGLDLQEQQIRNQFLQAAANQGINLSSLLSSQGSQFLPIT